MDSTMQPYIQEQGSPIPCRINFFLLTFPFFENTHYKVKCLPGFWLCVIFLVHPVQIASYDYSQVLTTAHFPKILVTKSVSQRIFKPSSRKYYCLTFTGICFLFRFYL
jgi:hypothetical protein